MEVVLLVHVRETLQRLKHYVTNHQFWKQLFPILHQLVYVHVEELKHKVQSATIEDHFIQLYDVWMTEFHQRLNLFLVDALVPLGVLLFHTLYRNNLS